MADTCEERWQTRKSTVLERNMHMYNNPVMSDINFAFPDHEKRIISAHKYVLATSSPVFFVMFYGELRETNETIEIGESDPDIFLQFLRFLYCDDASFQNENNAIQLLYLADKYDVPSLAAKCNEFQDRAMEPLNAFGIVPHARKLNHEKLERSCWEVIDYNAKEIMDDNSFSELSHELLLDVVKRSSLRIDEVSLFKAVDRWATKRCADETMAVDGASKRSLLGEELLRKIRFPVMSPQEFSDAVIPSDEIIDVLKQFSSVSISGAYKFLSDPRTKGDVSADSCALGSTHDSSFAVLSSSLMPFYSEKPDSEHNRNRVNSNTLVSGVCSGKFTPIPADNHYIGEVLALLFQPAVMKKK
ncbi:BTB/POZ domain-containing protein 6 [Stylophora pistillata]|uniref:BTB/POZ domain-containing protein 6 n=1 Tax=Stylophora pistillata TaxID=50429 RepID=A0A2B4SUY1_STYPI|nr:BTB/POZ domain-containing protein 6 [Stylophora pistillata]